jgi:transposase
MEVKITNKALAPIPLEIIAQLSRDDLITIVSQEMQTRKILLERPQALSEILFHLQDDYLKLLKRMYRKKSERRNKGNRQKGRILPSGTRRPKRQLPSERYPWAEKREIFHRSETTPICNCCNKTMKPLGTYERSECLSVVPKKYFIEVHLREKYCCTCNDGKPVTTPMWPRIFPGSSYSDDFVIDASLSKFCDLIPLERYCAIAARSDMPGIPPASVIALIVRFAFFLKPVFELVRKETLDAEVLCADETTHRMLENAGEKKTWYLWAFLSKTGGFFEIHNTRSGDVANEILQESNCSYFMSDVYSGYNKAIRLANTSRKANLMRAIETSHCNAHARRKFTPQERGSAIVDESADIILDTYSKIYQLESLAKNKSSEEILAIRALMRPHFESMKAHLESKREEYSNKSGMASAINYFLGNYNALILFLSVPSLPIDNNGSERFIRSPVIGRKTWYGTHSENGAVATATHFTLVETCKLNKVNPRAYYKAIVTAILGRDTLFTPYQYSQWESHKRTPD